jgi:DNA-3-methyladenine glycosylase I
LLCAAGDSSGDPFLLARAGEILGFTLGASTPAAEAHLLELEPRVTFRHPLIRSAVYYRATDGDRRRVHEALAEATDPEADPDRRAWHRAVATTDFDEDVATELEHAAGRARGCCTRRPSSHCRGRVGRGRRDGRTCRLIVVEPGRDRLAEQRPRLPRSRAWRPTAGRISRSRRASSSARTPSTTTYARCTESSAFLRVDSCGRVRSSDRRDGVERRAGPRRRKHAGMSDWKVIGAERGADGKRRCGWSNGAPEYVAYHDEEWGRPVVDDARIYEKICLEGFQSGLSWLTILRKRKAFRKAFAGFDPAVVATYGARDIRRLLSDAAIVRHRGKIEAAIANAAATLAVQDACGSLAELVWSFEPPRRGRRVPIRLGEIPATSPEAAALSKSLKRYGFRFVGPTTVYAAMQSLGIVNDHLRGCYVRAACERARRALHRH